MKKSNSKKKSHENGMYVRWPPVLRDWLTSRAEQRGCGSPQEFLREIVREARESEQGQQREAQPA